VRPIQKDLKSGPRRAEYSIAAFDVEKT